VRGVNCLGGRCSSTSNAANDIGHLIDRLFRESGKTSMDREIKAIQIALKGILTKHETDLLEGLNHARFSTR
jgi:hypothetical protein